MTTIMAVPIINEARTPAAVSDSRPRRRGRLLDPIAVALLATVVSGAGASRPSLWYDEGATISASASRSLPELWRLLGRIDAVHGFYYLLMHGWFAIFPLNFQQFRLNLITNWFPQSAASHRSSLR